MIRSKKTYPRGHCPACGKLVALGQDGALRRHRSPRAPYCRGTGYKPMGKAS